MQRYFCHDPRTAAIARAVALMLAVTGCAVAFEDLCSAAAPPVISIREHGEVDAALRVLDLWIETTVADREQPGLSIGIVYDDALLWAKGYGFADLENDIPASPSTGYRIASISKLFTATAIVELRDAGTLQLDDPIKKWLTWFKINDVHPDDPVITIRHLLTHTSGLPRELSDTYWNDMSFPDRKRMRKMIAQEETIFPTETEWKYSNLALSLAGEIVAEASGKSYPEYVTKRILEPLRMTSTHILPTPETPGLATGYGKRIPGKARAVMPFTDAGAFVPAGNFSSSVEDLARFVSLQFQDGPAEGSQILRGSTLREMHRVHWLKPDWQSGWGLGFGVSRVNGQVRIGHGGSVPGHRTQIGLAPDAKFGAIVLTNAEDGRPSDYLDQAFEIVGPAVVKAVEEAKEAEPAAETDAAWAKYTGTYVWEGDSFSFRVMILNGELTVVDPSDANPWESRIVLELAGEHTFRMKDGFQSGELVHFEFDEKDTVQRVVFPGYYFEKQKSP